MNAVLRLFLAAAIFGGIPACDSKEKAEQSGAAAGEAPPSKARSRPEISSEEKERRADYKNSPGLAMNRNADIRDLLTRPKPDWLVLGPPVATSVLPEEDRSASLRAAAASKVSFAAGQQIKSAGAVSLPEGISGKEWASAILNPDGTRLLMVPLEMTVAPTLFKVEGNSAVETGKEEIPVVNFDDSRRWFIQWESWASDSELVGVLNEEDFSGHVTVRVGIYLYDVDSKTLRRVELPPEITSAEDPMIEIVAVSSDVLVINTREGEQIVSLGK